MKILSSNEIKDKRVAYIPSPVLNIELLLYESQLHLKKYI